MTIIQFALMSVAAVYIIISSILTRRVRKFIGPAKGTGWTISFIIAMFWPCAVIAWSIFSVYKFLTGGA